MVFGHLRQLKLMNYVVGVEVEKAADAAAKNGA